MYIWVAAGHVTAKKDNNKIQFHYLVVHTISCHVVEKMNH